MRFEDFYSNTQQSKHVKNLHEGNIFQKVTPEDAINMAEVLHRKNKSIPKELEDIIASEPVHAVRYARRVLKGRFPQGEEAILNSAYDAQYISFLKSIGYEDVEESITHQNMSPDDAYDKANDLFNNLEPIPKELEDIIATDAQNALNYAYYILKGRFLKGEPSISKNGMMALDYAMEVIGGRFPEGEEAISEDPELHDEYIEFLNSIGYEDLEESTSNNPYEKLSSDQAYDMAIDLSSKNIPVPKELEEIIAKDPHNAYFYAKYVVKGRFPQGEPMIMSDLDTKGYYIRFLNKIGYEDLEESNSNKQNNPYKNLSPENAYYKVVDLFHNKNEPIPKELEEIMATDPSYAYFYAIDFIKSRFPQGEEAILNGPYKDNYINFLKSINYQDVEESFKQFFNSNVQESYTPLTPKEAYERALRLDRHGSKIPKEMEDVIAKDAKASLKYALHVKRARFEKGEPVIATDPEMSYNYAKHIIKGRFPQGEEVIMRSIQKDAYVRFLREINYSDVEESFVNFFNSTVNESFIPDDPEEAYELAKNYQRSNKQIPEEVEDVLAESPKYSYMYAKYILGDKPFPKGEPVISQSYTYALDYARKVLKGRFPLAEKFLSKDPDFAFLYARDVLKGRFPEGEEAIMSLYHTKRDYIKFLKYIGYEDVEESAFTKGTLMDILDVVRGLIHKNLPVPDKMINAIASDAFTSHIYARDVIEKPFPEGEKAIAKDGYWSYFYARDVMHGRFPEGEKAILRSMYKDDYLDYLKSINYQDLEESFELYFTEAKRKVRPPTEKEKTDPHKAYLYTKNVTKERWPEGEPVIMKNPFSAAYYARDIIKGKWPEAEEVIKTTPSAAAIYAIEAIKSRWPEGEEVIFTDNSWKNDYIEFLKSINYQDVEESFELYFTESIDSKSQQKIARKALSEAIKLASSNKPIPKELEDAIAKDGKMSIEYAYEILKKPFPKGEKAILSSPEASSSYASFVLKHRWPEAEPIILTDLSAIIQYVVYCIKGKWPEAEPLIAKKSDTSLTYAKYIIKDKWPEGEKAISRSPEDSYRYAYEVLNDRFELGEKTIARYSYPAKDYAINVIKGRWPDGEEAIMKTPSTKKEYIQFLKSINYQDVEETFELYFTESSVRPPTEKEKRDFALGLNYAKNVLKDRWPELEQTLLNLGSAIPLSLYTYAKDVVKDRWPEAEPFIIDAGTIAPDYARDVIKGRWPELEQSLLENVDLLGNEIDTYTLEVIMYYIYEVVKGRWEEIEPTILQFGDLKRDYINFLKELNYQDVEESHRSGKRLA